MYNPSRGGVRGGADQFTWESVKTDKHRENYLGHSLMAPVGRWQKGKDLSWYAKERKDDKTQELIDKSEMASIKRAEEEAMLIALGHNIVRKTQTLTKEDMREALKRNTERDDHHIERIDGVGATSQRIAALSGVRKDARQNNEGVAFETVRERNIAEDDDKGSESMSGERKKNKKSKKHKKEKKHKKHHKQPHDSDLSEDSSKYKMKYQRSESDEDDDDSKKSSKSKYFKKSEHRYERHSESSHSDNKKSSKLKKHKLSKTKNKDLVDSDSSNSSEKRSSKVKIHKKSKIKHRDRSSDSGSPTDIADYNTKSKKRDFDHDEKKSSLKERSNTKSKHKHKDYSSADFDQKSHSDSEKRYHKRHKKQKEYVKRQRHDTSESD